MPVAHVKDRSKRSIDQARACSHLTTAARIVEHPVNVLLAAAKAEDILRFLSLDFFVSIVSVPIFCVLIVNKN